jgi:hypothetical protein
MVREYDPDDVVYASEAAFTQDMVLVTRAVLHGCEAPPDRQAVTYRSRGVITAENS